MAIRLGLGLSRGTPLVLGLTCFVIALPTWITGFGAIGAMLVAVGAALLLERRRSPSKDS